MREPEPQSRPPNRPGGEGKAACRWVALRHGISNAGNDHLHVVVPLVREDGTKASTWNDRPRERLERTVRACAAAAGDEAEFVRRLRQGGLRVRPRFAAG
ncbi:MAG: hypothetical protein M3Y17_06905 [Actinomycetota bacterium]|nr:hypothetical protein [Actinomycetota bacterium]